MSLLDNLPDFQVREKEQCPICKRFYTDLSRHNCSKKSIRKKVDFKSKYHFKVVFDSIKNIRKKGDVKESLDYLKNYFEL